MSSTIPRVSVLLAVHQGAPTLPKTLESLKAQTFLDWELIAVNDGSTDTTQAVLETFHRSVNQQVTMLQQPTNQGLTRSLIAAATHARGRYLARIDAGDLFAPEKLAKQVSFLDAHPKIVVVGCNYLNVLMPKGQTRQSRVPLTDQEIRRSIHRKNPFAHSCVLMRAISYQAASGYDSHVRLGQDYELWFRFLRQGAAANLPEVLCTRTMSEDSLSFQKQRAQMWQTLKTQWKYLHKTNPLHYLYLLEPFLVMITPGFLRRLKRRS